MFFFFFMGLLRVREGFLGVLCGFAWAVLWFIGVVIGGLSWVS